jgi:hypothetical protein
MRTFAVLAVSLVVAAAVAAVVWFFTMLVGPQIVSDMLGDECYDSPCFISGSDRAKTISFAFAVVVAALSACAVLWLGWRIAAKPGPAREPERRRDHGDHDHP